MKLVIQYSNKGAEPKLIHFGGSNQDSLDAFNSSKHQGYRTELLTVGMCQKRFYNESYKAKAVKKAKKVEEVIENKED